MNFTQRTSSSAPTATHEELVRAFCRRFYRNESTHLVSNGLSTEILILPSDLLPSNKERLNTKIRHGMEYATRAVDIETANALKYVAGPDADPLTFRALFLYLSDECSRLNKPKSLLTALRDAGVGLAPENTYWASDLRPTVMKALRELGMAESHGPVIDEWYNNNSFHIGTEYNGKRPYSEEYTGTYIALAKAINHIQNSDGLNHAISYILGNKLTIQSESLEKMLERANQYATDPTTLKNRIRMGEGMRVDTLLDVIAKLELDVPEPLPEQAQATKAFAKDICRHVPDLVLELLALQEYSIAYADDRNIAYAYPRDNLPGVSDSLNQSSRESVGLRQARFHMIFTSNGARKNSDDLSDPHLKPLICANTICHEAVHIGFNSLSEAEKSNTFEHMDALQQALRHAPPNPLLDDYLTVMDWSTLREIADFDHYKSYAKINNGDKPEERERKMAHSIAQRKEEALCETFAVLSCELKDKRQQLFELLPELGAVFADAEHAIAKCTEQERLSELNRTNGFQIR